MGGTYVDSYVVRVKKGQKLHVHVENQTEHSKLSFDPYWPKQKRGLDAIYLKIAGVAWHPGPVITKFGS